ncbi:hypothetical protein [Kordia sp.]|uniref:hypothetical protein n=1 Tax=Kordia sp. TaxID=1965332 RepID=UPI003B5BBC19
MLSLKKIQIAKVDSFMIVGRGLETGEIDCAADESRTPKGGRTQSTSFDADCSTAAS